MSYEHVWAVIGILTLLAAVALAVWSRHLKEAKKVALREMIHQERMAAMEKGVALPELPADAAGGFGETAGGPAWVRAASLLAGLVLVLGGFGLTVAFLLIGPGTGVSDLGLLWPVGLVPAFTGCGLLLFVLVERLSGRGSGR